MIGIAESNYRITWISVRWCNRKKSCHLLSTISITMSLQLYFSFVPWDRNPGNTVL